jgi:hypothetical protein
VRFEIGGEHGISPEEEILSGILLFPEIVIGPEIGTVAMLDHSKWLS